MSASRANASIRPLRVGACLSLTGRFARFGIQAARGLEAWQSLAESAELVIEDDGGSPQRLERVLPEVARRSDVLLGPYSTLLARTAGRIAADNGWLMWNHGGSGDDVENAHQGHVISILTPATRYAEPFLYRLASDRSVGRLWMMHGKGSFGNQVTAGAEAAARRLGIASYRSGPGKLPSPGEMPGPWGLICAGTFEEDVEAVRRARGLPDPPSTVCAVAAGVREFGEAVADATGIFGVGQWFPGCHDVAALGPSEAAFLAAYAALCPGSPPDYPAAQAAASAVLAAHCVTLAGDTTREPLWEAALGLSTSTLFGGFRINAGGVQVGHDAVLTRWAAGGPVAA
jgi:hypothetical protein